MNVITIAGRIGKDSELRFLQNGDPVLGFSVADDMGKDKGAIWWECSLFGKRGESLAPYLLKGSQVTVIGQVSERAWTDKNGQERKSFGVRVSEIALQGGKQETAEPRQAPAPSARPPAQRTAPAKSNGFDDMDSDVPF